MDDEHYIDGDHNVGVFNHFNHNSYGYCYQNPVKYLDPNGKQSDAVKPKVVDVFIPEALWPNVYKTHLMGIAKGNPTILTYDSDKSAARQRRAEAQRANGGLKIPQQHLDEYPYASTKEGGANAAVNSTPAKENMSHGGYLGALVVINKMKSGDKFNVILVPKLPNEPQKVPVEVPVPSPIPIRAPTFMDEMSEITGLTGIALIIYIIISEGSRVIPPRNLIPIP